ncbi:hypothetical protein EUTSA_v10022448mg [Eutrema salsugineum]|nr:hypothetical protein EUTSA_v10022448mg [Eutrema salsugineum]
MKSCRCRVLQFFLRLISVLSLCLLTIPFITCWIWRLAFVRSFGEAQSLFFLSHISTTVILTDCLLGFLLSTCIFFIFRGATSLRGHFRHLRENIPFYELVGMKGPVFHLFENASTVLACNMIFIGVGIFVPFTLGRVLSYHVSWLFVAARGPAVTASVIDIGLSLGNLSLKSALTSVSNLANEGQENGLLGQLTEIMKVTGSGMNGATITLSIAADLLKGSVAGSSKLSDVTTLTVGYMFIVFLVFIYLGIISLILYAKGEPLTIGRFYGVTSVVETVPPLLRQFLAVMGIGFRVAFFVVFVLGIFPLMGGWWLDVCTVRMFGKTMSHRVQFLSVSPLASSLVHWTVGIMYMWQIFIVENLLREVLRPGVLYFLMDPADQDNTFQDLIDGSVVKLAKEILLEYAEFGSLIVMLVFLPVKLAIWTAPSIFPLDIS